MEFLRITAPDGTRKYIPDNYVVQIDTTADTLDAGSEYRAPNVVRGRISLVKYYDGGNTEPGVITVASVGAYDGTNNRYEYGCFTVDSAFVAALTN